MAAALPDERRCGRLLKAAEARRLAAYAALRQALEGPGFRLLLLDGIALAVVTKRIRVSAFCRRREIDPDVRFVLNEFSGRSG